MSIQNLEPRHLWNHFDSIRSIPRPSRHEEKIREHLLRWAKERGFGTRVDKAGNMVVTVPATKGHEKAPVLVLQAHMDMVCEKNADVTFDFSHDAIQLERDGDWLKAKGTTLGADNGIGLAAALAVADDPAVVHGPLELLITMDEETGLTGAAELDPSLVGGRRMLNLDSEELYAIYIGCSGGGNSVFTLPVEGEAPARGGRTVEIAVTGLKGGHSGMEIQHQRGNAIRLLARILRALGDDIRIDKIDGGNAHNAIPREARAVITLPAPGLDTLRHAVQGQSVAIKEELAVSDAGVTITVNDVSATPARVMTADSTRRVIGMLTSLPHGVDAMSLDVPGLVETSSNLAAVKTEGDSVTVLMSVRSSIRSSLIALRDRAQAAAELAGASIEHKDPYPGWKPNLKSEVLGTAKRVHKDQLGREPHLMAIHAGLECGVIGEKYPGMDMISFGPTIEGPHSPDERVNIPSVETFWKFLSALVTELA
ncbi:MAG TPA: aminoacyl-histidine dipeptidase [Candidatus Krumholzibacteria bacterium]|nr:aminoacyl-histidine dipeptidase [Candidatus Krumholzibacteria bacterium]